MWTSKHSPVLITRQTQCLRAVADAVTLDAPGCAPACEGSLRLLFVELPVPCLCLCIPCRLGLPRWGSNAAAGSSVCLASFLCFRVLPVQDAVILCLVLPQLHSDIRQLLLLCTGVMEDIVQNQHNEWVALACVQHGWGVAAWVCTACKISG